MPSNARRRSFPTTHWSVVRAAGQASSPEARAALAALCAAYWYPLYAFIRRQGVNADDAQDLTQEFFARLLERRDVEKARADRGRFRSFLLASARHFLLNHIASERALKRGGGHTTLSLDFADAEQRYRLAPMNLTTPETVFDRQWALTVLDRALGRIRHEFVEAGRRDAFEMLKDCLTGDGPPGGYQAVGRALGLSEGAVKVTVHRLRKRYRRVLREEIASTVCTEAEIDAETDYLVRVLSQ
jgi:RNA polymerase sigma-70 factor (ECF subfamily)